MRRDLTIKSGSLGGTSDFRVLAPIRKGFVPSLDAVTYKTRVKRVLRTLHIGRSGSHEHELARILSDAVERVGRIHSVGIAVLEPEDKVLLHVTFDGAWEAYVRVIWQKVARLLDLIFCNTEDYVPGYTSSYEKWGEWLKASQSEAAFLYATPGLTVDDVRYLRMQERIDRREAGDRAEQLMTRVRIPSAEEIAEAGIFEIDEMYGTDPTNAGFSIPLPPDVAGRPPFRHGVRSLVGLYRLADVYLPGTDDGDILHRAAHELLPEFVRMLNDGNTYSEGIARANKRFGEAMRWLLKPPGVPEVRRDLPLALPDKPPLGDAANVQGGILSPYADADHGCALLLQFESPAALPEFLERLHVTTAAAAPLKPGEVATNVAFTIEGLRFAGLSDDEVRKLPEEFVQGMERRAGLLGDVRINHPRRWRLPALNWDRGVDAPDLGEDDASPRIDLSAVHAMVQVRVQATGNTPQARAQLMARLRECVGKNAGVKPLSLQWMQRWRNGKSQFEEHFGFLDANSDPTLFKDEAGDLFANQVHLGEILCGYPNLADKTGACGDGADGIASFLCDGSFLVVRKLRQDIEALDAALAAAEQDAKTIGLPLGRADFMARMMGRYPSGHAKAGEPLVAFDDEHKASNDFHFDHDQDGAICPFHAHIRRAHPRVTDPEEASRPARIVRRGMSYGPHHDRHAKNAKESLQQERGLVFMAYNANLGEQFEVVQGWLSGGNSSGSYSGQSDPFVGLAEPGRLRHFRFEHEGKTVRMALDGSDRLHDTPRPFVRLEWGAYFFAPSMAALAELGRRAEASRQSVVWKVADGERAIARLRDIEAQGDPEEARRAWKEALEDPDASVTFTTASIWAAIRANHGGVLRTPFGVLVADRDLVQNVLADTAGNLTITGYRDRMQETFGVLYLGHDPGQRDRAYERESEACNAAIMALDPYAIFKDARTATLRTLDELVKDAKDHAIKDREQTWELTVEARELIDPLLADFCEAWFGLRNGAFFMRAGYQWDWTKGQPPNYPGHFLSPSRYIFQPHPGSDVKRYGAMHGRAVQAAMIDFLRQERDAITAPVSRAVLDSPLGADMEFAARTIAGAMMGFVPTVEGNLRRMLNEWLREGKLWALRARIGSQPAADFTDACNRLGDDFIPAMQLRAVPELMWRRAIKPHSIGAMEVEEGEIVVAGAISATQQSLQQGNRDVHHAFGGNRRAGSHPTHACPGMYPALAVMIGFFSALVESTLPLRAGPGPLTISLDGIVPVTSPPDPQPTTFYDVMPLAHGFPAARVRLADARAFHFKAARLASAHAGPTIATFGDSWLYDFSFINALNPKERHRYSLISGLKKLNFQTRRFGTFGISLEGMTAKTTLKAIEKYLTDPKPGEPKPRAFLIGGGGNDVVADYALGADKTPLYKLLQKGAEPLNENEVRAFIDEKLAGHYQTILNVILANSDIPVLIHAYDHPIPDGVADFDTGPWLKPTFDIFGMTDLAVTREVMRRLIDRLNAVALSFQTKYPDRVHHVSLTTTLAKSYGDPGNYRKLWLNELHANDEGFDLLAGVVAAKLKELNIQAAAAVI